METNNDSSAVEEIVEVEDPQVTIMKLRNQIENFKLKMDDFSEYVQQMQEEKTKRTRKNNEKMELVAEKIFTHMGDLFDEIMEKVREKPVTTDEVQDEKFSEQLWKNTENTALNIIEEIKFVINEGASFTNE